MNSQRARSRPSEGRVRERRGSSCRRTETQAPRNHLCEVRLRDIRFSQGSISTTFSDGKSLEHTIQELLRNPKAVQHIKRIAVVCRGGLVEPFESMDNRRLHCFKSALHPDAFIEVYAFKDKEAYEKVYGPYYDQKTSSCTGGQVIQLMGQADETKLFPMPSHSTWYVQWRIPEIRLQTAASLRICDSCLHIRGTLRQVEEAARRFQRVIASFQSEEVNLESWEAWMLVKRAAETQWAVWLQQSVKVWLDRTCPLVWVYGSADVVPSVVKMLRASANNQQCV